MKSQKPDLNRVKNKVSYRSFLKSLALGGLFIALTATGALISIPIGLVPITLQVPMVILCGYVLGARNGFFTQIGYILIGVAGLPVFAGGQSGPAIIASPTFGYLISFPITALIIGYLSTHISKKKIFTTLSIFIAGLVPIYLLGTAYLYLYMNYFLEKQMKISTAIAVGIVPFILWDLLKVIIAATIATRLEYLIKARK